MNVKSLDDLTTAKVLLVDKPLGWTSFDVVNKIRSTIKQTFHIRKIKVGHAGTLDPLATGLLIICTGKMTKEITRFQGLDKTYVGTLKLGATTPTYDAEVSEDVFYPTSHIDDDMIYKAAASLTGDISQVPPMFSAIKKDGKRLYKLARQQRKVHIDPRPVHVSSFNIESIQMPFVSFTICCSKGTYIRSLAYDLGIKLSSGAYLTALRRTKIGNHDVGKAWQVAELVAQIRLLI